MAGCRKASSSAGKIAPWRFPLEFLKPVVDVYRERVVALRNQHMGLHIAKAQMREHLRRLQVEVVGPELLRAYQGSGKPMPPWASEEKVGLRRTYTFLKEHIPVGAELLMPVVPVSSRARRVVHMRTVGWLCQVFCMLYLDIEAVDMNEFERCQYLSRSADVMWCG